MTIAPSKLRIVVLGYLVRGPLGGLAWHYLQYVAGLARLGHDVFFLEDSDDYPSCYDPVQNVMLTDPAYGLAFATHAFDRLGLGDTIGVLRRASWPLVRPRGRRGARRVQPPPMSC